MAKNIAIIFFGKAIHSLSKIGEELYFEPLDHGLALRTVNSSRSAYACFVFSPSFFIHYNDRSTGASQDNGEETEAPIKCKIGVKSCLTVFRSLSTLEKTVDRCQITLNMKEARLVFQLYCRHGIVKTHNLAFIECETLQAVFSRDTTPNKLTAESRLLCDAVVNFQTNQEEVTLCVSPNKVLFKNYVDDDPDPTKLIRTELGMDPEEFQNYQINEDADVTFCLKELRAILMFCEAGNLPISIDFENAGRPIIFTVDSDSTFEANFVLATLADPVSSSQASTQQNTQRTTQHTQATSARNRQRPAPAPASMSAGSNRYENRAISSTHSVHNGDGDNSNSTLPNRTLQRTSNSSNTTASQSLQQDSTIDINDQTTFRTQRKSLGRSSVQNDLNKNHMAHKPATFGSCDGDTTRNEAVNANSDRGSSESGSGQSPVIPVQNKTMAGRSMLLRGGDSSDGTASEEDEEDMVPGTPPAKKFKSILFNVSARESASQSQSTIQTSVAPRVILAPDTDDEGD